ncbi:MAG: hypothetical protein EA378_04825 [Phycisphaerales bacterium]|nr:MAG: hypothetical protein EA378_04825 [Phycisphaerales bacterium]
MASAFGKLPPAAQAGAVLVTGGGLMGALFAFGDGRVIAIVLGGLVVVALLLVVYKLLLKQADKRKSRPFEQGLADNSSTAPQDLSDPARRASMDALRKKFEEGVSVFKTHGKDIYTMPWYMLVGEPGSGKTEAIRHCNVGFPPGLQDELQGAGGTINMNWWFTNQAVILDTAGRLMFENIAPGQTSEWREFLGLLKRNRPNCPINGMLLVIPADSLIKDSADELEKKGGKIAQQLDQIQRVLGVRFPVFVVVTKCDLINGFREFFDDVHDPRLQHQIMGWSNESGLDEAFDPKAVANHLGVVQQRLRRRRLSLLSDPVPTSESDGARIDEVDALYAFPESFVGISPRLQRYLEMIFVSGEWSNKPLFLRGIYFTSSMREGSALDADLAEALGVPLESLPEGRVWERDSAFFLRDLFVEKVFKERGLVTRASNARQMQRRRQAAILGSTAGVALLLLVLTWLGATTFAKRVGEPTRFWERTAERLVGAQDETVAAIYPNPPASMNYEYVGDQPLFGEREGPGLASFLDEVRERESQPLRVPLIFRPVAVFSADIDRLRREAHAAVLARTVLAPAAEASRRRIADDRTAWTATKTEALAELLRLEAAAVEGATPREDGPSVDVLKLVEFALLDPADPARASDSMARLSAQGAGSVRRSAEVAFSSHIPASASGAGTEGSRAAVEAGLSRFLSVWAEGGRPPGRLGELLELRDALAELEEAERVLVTEVSFPASDDSPEVHRAGAERWRSRLARVVAARERADAVIDVLGGGSDVAGVLRVAELEATTEAGEAFDRLLAELERAAPPDANGRASHDGSPQSAALFAWAERLRGARATLRERSSGLARQIGTDLTARSARDLGQTAAGRSYGARVDAYERADAALTSMTALGREPGGFIEAAAAVETERRAAAEAIERSLGAVPPDSAEGSRSACTVVLEAAARVGRTAAADRLVAEVRDAGSVMDLLIDRAEASPNADRGASLPDFVMSSARGGAYATEFTPEVAQPFLSAWASVDGWAERARGGGTPLFLDQARVLRSYRDLEPELAEFAEDYVRYWAEDVPLAVAAPSYDDWSSYRSDLVRLERDMREADRGLRSVSERVMAALADLPAGFDAELLELAKEAVEVADRDQRAPRGRRGATRLDEIGDALRRWTALGTTAETASARVLGLRPEEFDRTYLPAEVYSRRPFGVSEVFWNSVFERGLRSLADGRQIADRATLDALASRPSAAMPFCKGTRSSLNAEESRRFIGEIVRIGSSLPAPRSGTPGAFLGEGALVNVPAIDEALALMRGEGLLRGNERAWFDRLQRIASWLDDSQGALTVELILLPQQTSGVEAVTGSYAFVSAPGLDRRQATRRGEALVLGSARLPMDGPLSVDFHTVETGPVSARLTFAPPWGVLAAYVEGGAALPGLRGFQEVWAVPVQVEPLGDRGSALPYVIGVRFSRTPVEPEVWPTSDEWAGAR